MKALQKAIKELKDYEDVIENNWNNFVPIQDAVEILEKFEINLLNEIEYEARRTPKKQRTL